MTLSTTDIRARFPALTRRHSNVSVAYVDGSHVRIFVPTGDAFAGMMIPVADSAGDAIVDEQLGRVKRCASPRCTRVFLDVTKNATRRWCDMKTCGNREKARRRRSAR